TGFPITRQRGSRMTRDDWRAVGIAVFIFILVFGLSIIAAPARDLDGRYAASPLKPWFESLQSKRGVACCADADGNVLLDSDWKSSGGHYAVRIEGEWIAVPDEAVVERPNLDGRHHRMAVVQQRAGYDSLL